MFIKNRFQRFADKKVSNGISELIYFDSKEKVFVKSKNKYHKKVGFVTVAIGSSALNDFEQVYGDPCNRIFSSKLNIYLLILLPLIEIIINGISDYIDNNKENRFSYVYLPIESAEKLYWKSLISDILISFLDIGLMVFMMSFTPASGGRSAAIYILEIYLLSGVPNYFEKILTYKIIKKEERKL